MTDEKVWRALISAAFDLGMSLESVISYVRARVTGVSLATINQGVLDEFDKREDDAFRADLAQLDAVVGEESREFSSVIQAATAGGAGPLQALENLEAATGDRYARVRLAVEVRAFFRELPALPPGHQAELDTLEEQIFEMHLAARRQRKATPTDVS